MARTRGEIKRAKANQAKFAQAIAIGGPMREPNGRLSRRKAEVQVRTEASERNAKETMLTARMRHFPKIAMVDEMDPGEPNLGTIQGVWCLEGRITRDQWEAAEWFIERRKAWARAIEVPGEPIDNPARGGFDEASHEAFCKAAKQQWREIMDCLQEASIINRSPIIAAMDAILIRQTPLDHMLGELRQGCNALRKAFL